MQTLHFGRFSYLNYPIANDTSWSDFRIIDLANPSSPQDAATKAYVDNMIGGGDWWVRVDSLHTIQPYYDGDDVFTTGKVTAAKLITIGGTASQFVKGDGTLDDYSGGDILWCRVESLQEVHPIHDGDSIFTTGKITGGNAYFSGVVGIGTNDPIAILDVLYAGGDTSAIRAGGSSPTGYGEIDIYNDLKDTDYMLMIFMNGSETTGGGSWGTPNLASIQASFDLAIGAWNSGKIYFFTGNDETTRMTITNDGMVLINTTTPTDDLGNVFEIAGSTFMHQSSTDTWPWLTIGSNDPSGGAGITISSDVENQDMSIGIDNSEMGNDAYLMSRNVDLTIQTPTANNIKFILNGNPDNAPSVIFTPAGSVGIGTPTPYANLHVVAPTTAYVFPSTGILDDFNREDQGPPPSANWTEIDGDIGFVILNNQLTAGSEEQWHGGAWNVSQYKNSEIYVTIASIPPDTGNYYFYLHLRYHDADYMAHIFEYDFTNEVITLYNWYWDDIAVFNQTLSVGDSVGLSSIGDVVTAYYKPVGGVWRILGRGQSADNLDAGYIAIETEGPWAFTNFGGGPVVASSAIHSFQVDGSSALYVTNSIEGTAATGLITLSDEPADGDTITISAYYDGSLYHSVFEFDSDDSYNYDHYVVTLQGSAIATAGALATEISNSYWAGASAVDNGDGTVSVTSLYIGSISNIPITWSGTNISATGMSGGCGAIGQSVHIGDPASYWYNSNINGDASDAVKAKLGNLIIHSDEGWGPNDGDWPTDDRGLKIVNVSSADNEGGGWALIATPFEINVYEVNNNYTPIGPSDLYINDYSMGADGGGQHHTYIQNPEFSGDVVFENDLMRFNALNFSFMYAAGGPSFFGRGDFSIDPRSYSSYDVRIEDSTWSEREAGVPLRLISGGARSGCIVSFDFTPGAYTGFKIGDWLMPTVGGNSNAVFIVTDVDTDGAIVSIDLAAGGSGYEVANHVSLNKFNAEGGGNSTDSEINITEVADTTDTDGGNLVLASGTSTGTGVSKIVFQAPAVGTTGTTVNAVEDVMAVISGRIEIYKDVRHTTGQKVIYDGGGL